VGEGAGLLLEDAAGFEDDEVRNALDVEAGGEVGVAVGVDFEDDGFAGEVGGDAADLRSDHATRAAPSGPKIDENGDARVAFNVFEGRGIDVEGFGERCERRLAGSAAASVGEVLGRHAVFAATLCAMSASLEKRGKLSEAG